MNNNIKRFLRVLTMATSTLRHSKTQASQRELQISNNRVNLYYK